MGLAHGTWSAPGLERKKIRHIYPVLVLLHPYPQNVATWQLLQQHIPTPEHIQCGYEFLTTQVHHAQILTAEELEMLEPLLHNGELSLPDVLNAKTGNPFWIVQSMFLTRNHSISSLLHRIGYEPTNILTNDKSMRCANWKQDHRRLGSRLQTDCSRSNL